MLISKTFKAGLLGAALFAALPGAAQAQGFLVSANGKVAIGVAAAGNLDTDATALVPAGPSTANAGPLGIAYDFTGQGGRSGWQDALSPGCLCEGYGVAGNGVGSFANGNSGVSGIVAATSFIAGTSITTTGTAAAGLSVTQVVTRGVETATGALFKAEVTIANNTGATVTDVQYGRAMDWDVPPSEFNEYVTHAGVALGGSSLLLRATNNGFASGDPITGIADGGIGAVPNTNGDQNGIDDHGSLFIFGFGDLVDGASKTITIFYGAGANLRDALSLIGLSGAELYSFGQSSGCTTATFGTRCDDLPTFIFAFDNVGLPPIGVPAPAALGLFGLGLLGLGLAQRRRA